MAALVVVFLASDDYRVRYLDIRVSAAKPTEIRVFFDTGDSFRAEQSSSRRLAGGEQDHDLRFLLPPGGVHRVRIDFEPPAETIVINRVGVLDLFRGHFEELGLERLLPLHEIAGQSLTRDGLSLRSAGTDPQLVLTFDNDPWERWRVHPGLLVASTFLCYPFAWLFTGAYGRLTARYRNLRGRRTNAVVMSGYRAEPRKGHYSFLFVSAVFWCGLAFFVVRGDTGIIEIAPKGQERIVYTSELKPTEFSLYRQDNLEIIARVYRPVGRDGPFPALLVLHGNYHKGQDHPLYRVLAEELAKGGVLAMTLDFAGYGRSQDPFASETPVDVSLETETRAALSYLASAGDVKPGHLGIVGHSMGADPALRIGLQADSVSHVVCIGPPRRVQQRFHTPSDQSLFWNWALQGGLRLYGRTAFPPWYTQEQWVDEILARDMIHQLPALARFHHKPVLFIDGDREPQADLDYLKWYVRRCTMPIGYATLPFADHDCNVYQKNGTVYYNPDTMSQLVELLVHWSDDSASGRPNISDYADNAMRWLFSRNRLVTD